MITTNQVDLICGAILSKSTLADDRIVISQQQLRAAVSDAVARLRYNELLGVVSFWKQLLAHQKAKQAKGGRQRHEDAEARKQIVADLWNQYPEWSEEEMQRHTLEHHHELFTAGSKAATITTKTLKGYRSRPVKLHGTETPETKPTTDALEKP